MWHRDGIVSYPAPKFLEAFFAVKYRVARASGRYPVRWKLGYSPPIVALICQVHKQAACVTIDWQYSLSIWLSRRVCYRRCTFHPLNRRTYTAILPNAINRVRARAIHPEYLETLTWHWPAETRSTNPVNIADQGNSAKHKHTHIHGMHACAAIVGGRAEASWRFYEQRRREAGGRFGHHVRLLVRFCCM